MRLWPFPAVPAKQRGTAARLWAEATAGQEVTADGQLRELGEEERAERRARFEALTHAAGP